MDFLENRYSQCAKGYDQRIRKLWPFYGALHSAMNAALRSVLKPESELLIVGAGTGTEIIELGKSNSGWRFTGVDPAQPMLDIAKAKIDAAGLSQRASLVRGYVDDLPQGKLYDGATAAMVCHFIADDGGKKIFLASIASRLKSGASLVLMDAYGDRHAPYMKPLIEAWKQQQNLAGVKWQEVEAGMEKRMKAIHFVSADRIEQLLAQAGFHRIQQFFQVFVLGGWIAAKT